VNWLLRLRAAAIAEKHFLESYNTRHRLMFLSDKQPPFTYQKLQSAFTHR
jgi:hypothetical protein